MGDIVIKHLAAADLPTACDLFNLFKEVFEEPGDAITPTSHLAELLANRRFICMAAIVDQKVVGGLTAHVLPQYYTASAEAYLYDIALHPNFQRKGLGTLLINTLKEYCQANNIAIIFGDANEEDDHAVAFYRSTGAGEDGVRHFTYEL